MSAATLGRRYERLLFFAAPLSLLCLVLLFVAIATNSQQDRLSARCFTLAVAAIGLHKADLDKSHKGLTPRSNGLPVDLSYKLDLQKVVIDSFLGSNCYRILQEQVDRRYLQSPDTILEALRREAAKLASGPISFRGIELPEKATISFFGTEIRIELMTFVQLLQLGLAPLLLLWLGSLYATRYRETLLVGTARSLSEIFPHIANMYPAVRYPQPRKRTYVQQYLPQVFNLLYALIRIGLLLIFVAPTAVAYIAGIFLLESTELPVLFYGLATMVGIFTFVLLLAELLPWHYAKTFPGPPLVRPKE